MKYRNEQILIMIMSKVIFILYSKTIDTNNIYHIYNNKEGLSIDKTCLWKVIKIFNL
jgi:hypothetical protein